MSSLNWGPYRNQPEARSCLGGFADQVLKQPLGVIWSADDDAVWLRSPIYDADGLALTLLARYDGITRPAPPPAPTFVDSVDKFLGGALTQMGQAQIDSAAAQLAAGKATDRFVYQHAIKPINDFINRYEYVKDGVTVAIDVAGVVAGGAAAVALATAGGGLLVTVGLAAGVVAGLASLCLLAEDGRHCWFTLRGDEAGKLALQSTSDFRWIEAVGPLLAIPDLALSGRAALREVAQFAGKADRAAAASAAAAERSRQAARELREVVADPDQSAPILARAASEAARRAADYQKMLRKATAANRKLMMAREAVLAYGGTLWGSSLYGYDPPELARNAAASLFTPRQPSGGLPAAVPGWMPPQVPGAPGIPIVPAPASPARVRLNSENNPWRLLEPQNGSCSTVPSSGLQLTTIVATRPRVGIRR